MVIRLPKKSEIVLAERILGNKSFHIHNVSSFITVLHSFYGYLKKYLVLIHSKMYLQVFSETEILIENFERQACE